MQTYQTGDSLIFKVPEREISCSRRRSIQRRSR